MRMWVSEVIGSIKARKLEVVRLLCHKGEGLWELRVAVSEKSKVESTPRSPDSEREVKEQNQLQKVQMSIVWKAWTQKNVQKDQIEINLIIVDEQL